MKILLINSVVDYGSTGKITRDLADELAKNNHEVIIAYGRNESKINEFTFNISNKIELAWHFLMTRLFGRHGLHSSFATRKLIKKIRDFNPDIIHIHNLHGYYLNVPKLMKYLKNMKNVKIVWTMHDMWAISGSSAHYSHAGCKLWDEGCVRCNDPKEYPKSFFFDREVRNFQWKKKSFSDFNDLTIIAVSEWQKKELKKSFLKQYEIVKIYNGVEFNLFPPKKTLNKPKNKIALLGVSTDWRSRKGLDDFIELANKNQNKYMITLVGLSEKQVKSIPDYINGLKKTNNFKELVQHYQTNDVFLNLSVEETMGMTTVEALASGTPAVVYDKTAVPEIIDNTVGAITPAGNIDKLGESIDDVVKRNISTEVCVDFAKKRYSKKNMMEQYFRIYKIKY